MKRKKLKCSFFRQLYLLYDCDGERFTRYINEVSGKNYKDSATAGRTFLFKEQDGRIEIVVWINQKLKVAEVLKAVYHEAGHCALLIFDQIGVNVNDYTDEIFLYTQEDLVQQIIGIIK